MIACIAVVLAIGAAMWLNAPEPAVEAQQTGAQVETAQTPKATEQADPLVAFRQEREQLRAMQTAQLNDVIYGENTDEETRALAQRTLLSLLAWAEQETTLEGVLRARGYADAVVTVHEDSVNVLVRAQSLTRQESAVILELVLRETDASSGEVKIIPIN